MRPLLFSSGNAHERPQAAAVGAASMRPLLFSSGNILGAAVVAYLLLLQ